MLKAGKARLNYLKFPFTAKMLCLGTVGEEFKSSSHSDGGRLLRAVKTSHWHHWLLENFAFHLGILHPSWGWVTFLKRVTFETTQCHLKPTATSSFTLALTIISLGSGNS